MKKQSNDISSALAAAITDGTPADICARYASLASAAAQADYGEWDSNIVVLDTETTGLSFNHDELIQIAAARVEKGRIADWYVTFVNPGKTIPDDIVRLTGITNADVAGAPAPGEALAALADFVGDATVVAHNAAFDKTFTTAHPEGYPLLENLWIDSLDLSRIALPRMKAHRLSDLGRAFGAPENTHRADDDVAATCYVLRILFAAVDAMPTSLLYTIGNLADQAEWPTGAVFASFAQRHLAACADDAVGASAAAAESSINLSADALPDANGKKPAFSLRALRKDRVAAAEGESKKDAADIPFDALDYPTPNEIEAAFDQDGLVGRLYADFEQRPEQKTMSLAIANAFATNDNLVVEAGTGVGKSMAYLIPSAMLAKRNHIAVGVATKTNALLDQLIYHELPDLAGAIDGGLTYAPLKGFTHYLCLRKVEALAKAGGRMRQVGNSQVSTAPSIAAALSFIEQTGYDDCDSLKIDYRAVPRVAITTASHDCLRRKCPFFGNACYVHGARRRAETADIVVTNHSLLFCDLALEGGLLPPIRHWVFDEAHGAEDEAREAFSVGIAADEILRMAVHVAADEASRNVFVRAQRVGVPDESDETETLFFGLLSKARSAGKAFQDAAEPFVAHMKDLLFFDTDKNKSYEFVDLWLNDDVRASATFRSVAEYGKLCADAAEKLITACQELVGYLESVDEAAAIQREIASIALQLKELTDAIGVIFGPANERYVYSATLSKKKDRPADKLMASPLYVGPELQRTLFARSMSVVFASATLTVNGSFATFERALGLNAPTADTERATATAVTMHLDSSFDFDSNMAIYVATDMPEPSDPRYLDALKSLLTEVHVAQGGSMLTLFTNRKEMEACYDAVLPVLHDNNLHAVCQKWGVSTKNLRDDFLKDESLSLFALKSFWEGFDAPGSTLRGVVIPKLPFSKPTDPLSCERAYRDDSAWAHYVLPAAVIDTKQAVGRLIRTATDRGVIIFADKRLVSKRYGTAFLKSMPSRTIKACTCEEIADDLRKRRVWSD